MFMFDDNLHSYDTFTFDEQKRDWKDFHIRPGLTIITLSSMSFVLALQECLFDTVFWLTSFCFRVWLQTPASKVLWPYGSI